jgi:hypothetical protein
VLLNMSILIIFMVECHCAHIGLIGYKERHTVALCSEFIFGIKMHHFVRERID